MPRVRIPVQRSALGLCLTPLLLAAGMAAAATRPTLDGELGGVGVSAAKTAWASPQLVAPGAALRGTVLADFESGSVVLESFDPAEDLEPDSWQVTNEEAYAGHWSLRLYGNCWKAQSIPGYAVNEETVFQAAAVIRSIGEMQAFGVSDGTHSLLYTFAGTQLPTTDMWEVVYQGAFSIGRWYLYLLPIGRDWMNRFGYTPVVTRLVYINDRDAGNGGVICFDQIVDVTADLPRPPQVEIVRGPQAVEKLSARLFRVGIQFHSQVYDPDTPADSLKFFWSFGDGGVSTEANPFHEFLVEADYTYTVNLFVRDPQWMWGRDSTQVRVDPGQPDLPISMTFVGDVMLARGYDSSGGLIDTYGPEFMFMPTFDFLGGAADLSVCNLECPLTDEGTPHPTKSIVFRGRPANVAGLAYAGFDAVSLANNHIIDYGQRGMEETQQVLDSRGIPWSGGDDNDYLALQPIYLNQRGVSIAFLGQCNRTGREYNYQPFLDAGYNKPGFGYFTEPNLDRALAQARPWADLVVIQSHSGIEYTTEPGRSEPAQFAGEPWDEVGPTWSRTRTADGEDPPPIDDSAPADEPVFRFPDRPSMTDRELRRHAVDAGADLVINHHPHVLQGFEVYNGVLIAHSLGNFVFDQNYAETMPSVIMKTEFDKDGFHSFTFRPAFIDDLVPKVAWGRLGREILDRQADYSRALGAIVTVDPAAVQGTIHLHPETIPWTAENFARTVPLVEENGARVTPPIERTGDGTLARILATSAPGAVEVRLGRELLWHGDFEDEGATFWNLNSDYEGYDGSVFHQGFRSLKLRRLSTNSGDVTTELEGYPAALGSREYSVAAWIRTQAAVSAGLAARIYTGRGGGLLGSYEVAADLNGTTDWTWYWSDFATAQDGWFLNLRAHLSRPNQGENAAWFDEARIISWDGWKALETPLDVEYPNNIRYLQFRLSDALDSLQVTWREEKIETVPTAIDPGGSSPAGAAAGRLFLSAPRPNPSAVETVLEYELPRAGRVLLEVYDVAGIRRATLVDRVEAAGSHRATWDARGLPSGVYFARLRAGDEGVTRKVMRLN
jgi:poly-gamma-glutamate capsule biosynthesis protein CapA/YwtB (metallophosphatase superfamily)